MYTDNETKKEDHRKDGWTDQQDCQIWKWRYDKLEL